jgi:hypothetical protein
MEAEMAVAIVAEMSSTDLNKTSGKVLDAAVEGPVRVRRRDQRFVILREDALDELLAAARENRPQPLAALLQDYDCEKVASLVGDFLADAPAGRELI